MEVRTATPGDYATFSRLFPELGVPDPVPGEAKFVRDMMATTLVAERDGVAVGVAFLQILKTTGYLRMIITDPAARRSGVGRALMDDVRARFRAAGCTEWRLNTLLTNAAAIALYESYGFRRSYLSKNVLFPWSLLDGRPPEVDMVRTIEPGDDGRVERATNILPGLLADARTKRDRALYMVEDEAGIQAAAVFDPSFPGAFPFRATRPAAAFALLLALRPHARPRDESLSVVVEDQPAIADALIARGGTLRLETMHMRAPL